MKDPWRWRRGALIRPSASWQVSSWEPGLAPGQKESSVGQTGNEHGRHHPGVVSGQGPGYRGQFFGVRSSGFYTAPSSTRSSAPFMIQAASGCPVNKKLNPGAHQNEADNGQTNDAYTVAMGGPATRIGDGAILHQRGRHGLSQPHRQDASGMGLRVLGKVIRGREVME